jgi:hypothetical protein
VASATFATTGTLAGAYFGFHAGSAGKPGQSKYVKRQKIRGIRGTEGPASSGLREAGRWILEALRTGAICRSCCSSPARKHWAAISAQPMRKAFSLGSGRQA